MPFVEQIYYGVNNDDPSKRHQVLACSPGVTKGAVHEIIQLCKGWGTVPASGLTYPALMSFPLKTSMASLRGNLYTIIRVNAGLVPSFHALIVNDADFTSYGHNPFALAAAFPFGGILTSEKPFSRVTLKPGKGNLAIIPLPSSSDVGIVDLVIEEALTASKSLLPLEQPSSQSDRTLALALVAMPKRFLRNLRFASFALGQNNNFTMAAIQTAGSTFVGWKRLLLAKAVGKTTPQNDQYVRKVRALLEVGDLDGLRKLDLLPQRPSASLNQPKFDKNRVIVTSSQSRMVKPSAGFSGTKNKPKAVRGINTGNRPGRRRRGDLNLTKFLMLVLGVVIVGFGGFWWWGQDGIIGSGASALPGIEKPVATASPLLEIVDAGKVYDKLIRKIFHASMGSLDHPSRDRVKALARLQAEAAGPLIQQAQLFLKLAGEGIKASSQHESETYRLEKLATYGAALECELSRLELAWISISSEVDWRDIGTLTEKQVSARRDSLALINRHSLETARKELGTSGLVQSVNAARIEVEGMASLIALFHAPSWTPQWESDLHMAAEKVPFSASKLTKAYGKSAFALIHLKKTEQTTQLATLAYSDAFGTEAGLPFDVVELLPSLRRQVRCFPKGEAPPVLMGTLAFYTALQEASIGKLPVDVVELEKLKNNKAVYFDPATYSDIAERIRFETAKKQIAEGKKATDMEDSYFLNADRNATLNLIAMFDDDLDQREWENFATTSVCPFFSRWARAKGCLVEQKQVDMEVEFEGDYCRLQHLNTVVASLAHEGQDWTAQWCDLNDQVETMQKKYTPSWISSSETIAEKHGMLGVMAKQLDYGGSVLVTEVVVRLGPDISATNNQVVVSLVKVNGSSVGQPLTLKLGPAAPAGSGWVGAGKLAWKFTIGKEESLTATVRDAATGKILQKTNYESLGQRVGCGALTQKKSSAHGSLQFKTDSGYWLGLELPELP